MRTSVLISAVLFATMHTSVQAQTCAVHGRGAGACSPSYASRVEGHITTLGINMALGAATVGITHALRGRSFWEGAAAGALGGGLSYVGKLVVTADFSGSGLAGREIAALGSSVVSNAMSDTGLLDQAVLPFGPVRFELRRVPELRFRARIDVPNLVLAFYSAAQSHLALDWSASLSSGALVYVDHAPATNWAGRHMAGVIILKDASTLVDRDMDRVLRHERVHLLQHDFTYSAWGRPAQAWVLKRGSFGSQVHAYADLRLDILAWIAMNTILAREDRPSEREAYFLVPSVQPDVMPALMATQSSMKPH